MEEQIIYNNPYKIDSNNYAKQLEKSNKNNKMMMEEKNERKK